MRSQSPLVRICVILGRSHRPTDRRTLSPTGRRKWWLWCSSQQSLAARIWGRSRGCWPASPASCPSSPPRSCTRTSMRRMQGLWPASRRRLQLRVAALPCLQWRRAETTVHCRGAGSRPADDVRLPDRTDDQVVRQPQVIWPTARSAAGWPPSAPAIIAVGFCLPAGGDSPYCQPRNPVSAPRLATASLGQTVLAVPL